MIRVGMDCHKLEDESENQRAGIGRHLYKLLEEISKRPELENKFRFYLYFKKSVPRIEFLNNNIFEKRIAKLPLFFPFFRPSYNIFFHIALPIHVLWDRINVTFFPSFMMPLFFIGKSLAVLTNDVFYEYKKGNLPYKYKLSYKLFANWAARRATLITTYTNTSKKEILEEISEKIDIRVNPLGVDVSELNKGSRGLRKGNYILFVGQAFPRRRLRESLEAFKIVKQNNPTLRFLIVGSDKYNPPIIDAIIKRINNKYKKAIKKVDSVNDRELRNLYRHAKLLIYISNVEAMGLPPLEALATGTAPVVADNNLTREIFEKSAFFVKDYDNPKEIAKVIRKGLTNKEARDRIIDSAPRILSKYTWPKHVDKFIITIRKINMQ